MAQDNLCGSQSERERWTFKKKIVGEKSEQGWYEVGGKSSQNARDTYVKL